MNTRRKVLAASAAGLLLGFGLCGIDGLLLSSGQQTYGGGFSLVGFALCSISVLLLLGTLFSFAVTGIIGYFKGRR